MINMKTENVYGENNMEEKLRNLLKALPHSYGSFIDGITNYATKKPERMQNVMNYIEGNKNLTCSNVVWFVSHQPDFYEDSVIFRNGTKTE